MVEKTKKPDQINRWWTSGRCGLMKSFQKLLKQLDMFKIKKLWKI